MEESEIYRVRREGAEGAMKIGRITPFSFGNEIEVLRHLDGNVAPRLIDSGEHEGRPYLVTEWLEGTDATNAASFGRHDRAAILALCTSVAPAYAELHERGVVHADVHPRNVIVAADRSVGLIDFGLSRVDGVSTRRMPRGGMYAFYEPEYLAGVRQGRQLPASFAGEQDAVRALLYQLISGTHYVDFRLEREEMVRQAEQEPPVPFASRGIPPWPEVERILFRGLDKDPAKRFASMRELADALCVAHADDEVLADATRQLVDEEIAILSRRPPPALPSPHASINYGAAGDGRQRLAVSLRCRPARRVRADRLRAQRAHAAAPRHAGVHRHVAASLRQPRSHPRPQRLAARGRALTRSRRRRARSRQRACPRSLAALRRHAAAARAAARDLPRHRPRLERLSLRDAALVAGVEDAAAIERHRATRTARRVGHPARPRRILATPPRRG